jgi:hypothetical protein
MIDRADRITHEPTSDAPEAQILPSAMISEES